MHRLEQLARDLGVVFRSQVRDRRQPSRHVELDIGQIVDVAGDARFTLRVAFDFQYLDDSLGGGGNLGIAGRCHLIQRSVAASVNETRVGAVNADFSPCKPANCIKRSSAFAKATSAADNAWALRLAPIIATSGPSKRSAWPSDFRFPQ